MIKRYRRKIILRFRHHEYYGEPTVAKTGTLAQVLAFKESAEDDTATVKVKAVGRQRFRILETRHQMDG